VVSFPPSPGVVLLRKGNGVSPSDVQLFAMLVWIPVAAIIEAALFGLVHAMNCPFIGLEDYRDRDGEDTYSAICPDAGKRKALFAR